MTIHTIFARSYNDLNLQDKLDYKLIGMDCIAEISNSTYNKSNNTISLLAEIKYENSSFCEIPKAIAKCIKGIDEFYNINNGIVEFAYKEINKYTRSNMNALVLYNYIYELYNELYNEHKTLKDIYTKVETKLATHYKIDAEKIKDSIKDIKKYEQELRFDKYIKDIVSNRKTNKKYLKNFEINYTEHKKVKDNIITYVMYNRNIIFDNKIKTVSFFVEFQNDTVSATHINTPKTSSDVYNIKYLQEFVPVKCYNPAGKYTEDDIESKPSNKKYIFDFFSLEPNITGENAYITENIIFKDDQFCITYDHFVKSVTLKSIKSKQELHSKNIIFAIPDKINIDGSSKQITISEDVIKGKSNWTLFRYKR